MNRRIPLLRQPLFRLEERFSKPDRGVRIAPKSSKASGRSWVAKYPASTASSGSLYLNILNLVKDFCSILHCIEDIEDLVAPSGDECDVVTYKPYRCLTISMQVEKVELRFRVHLPVLGPGLLDMLVSECRVPHLHIGEHHHLIHLDVVIHKIVDDQVSVGAVSDLSLSALHLDGVCEDILLRKVQDLPRITEHTADDRRTLALEEH